MSTNEMNVSEELAKKLSDEKMKKVIGGVNVTPEAAAALEMFLEEDSDGEEVVGKRGPGAKIIRR